MKGRGVEDMKDGCFVLLLLELFFLQGQLLLLSAMDFYTQGTAGEREREREREESPKTERVEKQSRQREL